MLKLRGLLCLEFDEVITKLWSLLLLILSNRSVSYHKLESYKEMARKYMKQRRASGLSRGLTRCGCRETRSMCPASQAGTSVRSRRSEPGPPVAPPSAASPAAACEPTCAHPCATPTSLLSSRTSPAPSSAASRSRSPPLKTAASPSPPRSAAIRTSSPPVPSPART
ncbi:hypothetical protein ZIOFF_005269 [Zingiber officinale]|uniref:Uncharacterized protein n=1 Tax=Zingiber officinale TaxID=94328 RepID=A0A8J5LUS1_ZINOF|nr:hypothetical protein ZIOFF_005269 [Zingiber officinale]